MPAPRPWHHLPALDGLRGLAALMVVVFHFYQNLPRPASLPARLLTQSTALGASGVDLFFVLSGFLITGILLAARGTPRAFRNFYARRSLRIFPLYYLALVGLSVACLALRYDPAFLKHTWWYWTYTQNVAETFFRDAPFRFPLANPQHFWSLAVEEHFYLLWPLLVLTLPPRLLPRVLLSFVALSALLRAAMLYRAYDPYLFTLTRLDALSTGALIAVLWPDPRAAARLTRAARLLLLPGLLAMAALYAASAGRRPAALEFLRYPLEAATFGALLLLTRSSPPGSLPHALFTHPLLRATGKYSYGLYVYHPFVILAVRGYLSRHPALSTPALLPLSLLATLALTYAVALVSWHAYESQFLKLKKFFDYDRPDDPAAPSRPTPDAAGTALAAP